MSKTNWEIVEAFGTPELIERLTNEAIGIAGATGSIGATATQNKFKDDELTTVASVEVRRVEA